MQEPTAEAGVQQLKETATPFEDDTELNASDVERTAQAVEAAGVEAKARTKACTDFIRRHGPEMKDPGPAIPGQHSETKQALARLLQRTNMCGRTTETVITTARGKKDSQWPLASPAPAAPATPAGAGHELPSAPAASSSAASSTRESQPTLTSSATAAPAAPPAQQEEEVPAPPST